MAHSMYMMRSTFANFFTQAEIVRTELVALFQNDFARQAVFSRVVDCHLILSALLRFLVHFVHLLHLNLGGATATSVAKGNTIFSHTWQ